MKKVKNTSQNPNPEWLGSGNPQAILDQEAKGQSEVVNSDQLPAKLNLVDRGKQSIEEIYAAMGIKVVGPTEGDELFFDVQLPAGWKKEGTDHSMWNRLLDDKGRERATFFYKAAFYDRDAFINFTSRYTSQSKYFDERIGDDKAKTQIVIDNATGIILFESEKHTWRNDVKFIEEANEYINKNFPEHKSFTAYWD